MGEIIIGLYVFVLATLAGREVIGKVPPTLHTPLMSGANAISGVAIIGAIVVTGASSGGLATILGVVAVAMATVNVVGGFMVTDRMLNMFKKHD
jgi:NAD(P) transhydrogenase subunit alpha